MIPHMHAVHMGVREHTHVQMHRVSFTNLVLFTEQGPMDVQQTNYSYWNGFALKLLLCTQSCLLVCCYL